MGVLIAVGVSVVISVVIDRPVSVGSVVPAIVSGLIIGIGLVWDVPTRLIARYRAGRAPRA